MSLTNFLRGHEEIARMTASMDLYFDLYNNSTFNLNITPEVVEASYKVPEELPQQGEFDLAIMYMYASYYMLMTGLMRSEYSLLKINALAEISGNMSKSIGEVSEHLNPTVQIEKSFKRTQHEMFEYSEKRAELELKLLETLSILNDEQLEQYYLETKEEADRLAKTN